ncbi:MAG: hypothetical protein FJ290_30405 [Planctomycetes bacterium]|nr:hypothetical protein [Planctomycetota bacterium]
MAQRQKKQPSGKKGQLPLWAQLRTAYGYATPEERAKFDKMAKAILRRKEVELQECASGCTDTSSTGGCRPGTACLFTCLQSAQK